MKSFVTPVGMRSLLEHLEEYGDRKAIVEVRPYKKPRSLGLNNYAWGFVITPMANYIGESPADTWSNCCGEYFGWVESSFPGGRQKPRRTTTTNEEGKRDVLNWEQMTNFVYFCKAKAAEIGCQVAA